MSVPAIFISGKPQILFWRTQISDLENLLVYLLWPSLPKGVIRMYKIPRKQAVWTNFWPIGVVTFLVRIWIPASLIKAETVSEKLRCHCDLLARRAPASYWSSRNWMGLPDLWVWIKSSHLLDRKRPVWAVNMLKAHLEAWCDRGPEINPLRMLS